MCFDIFFQLRNSFLLLFLVVLCCASSVVENNVPVEHIVTPNLVGAKLVGIFEDDHKPSHKYSKEAQIKAKSKSNLIKQTHVDLSKLHFCEENIFEDGTMRSVPTREPRCFLSPEYLDHEISRRKRDTKPTQMAKQFLIPAGSPKEVVADDSYIKLQVKMCSQPGGEVLVYDNGTRRILSRYKNGGTSFQCNQWTGDYEKSISDTNKIIVEYSLSGNDYELSEVYYEYLKDKGDVGNRTIEFKRSKDNIVIFKLELKYSEVEFTYEETNYHNFPQEMRPMGDLEMGPYEVTYKPNWVKTYILGKRSLCDVGEGSNCQDKFFVGIRIEILQLNLDFDRGDYLLVGPGERPGFWKNSKGQMIAQPIKEDDPQKHRIWINSDSAYIRLVTHNSLIDTKVDSPPALKFKWFPANDTLNDLQSGDVSQLLKEASIQVCFAGYECNYYKTVENLFVEEAVHIFNNYLIDHEKSVTTLINRDSVQIFDVEPIFYNKGHYTDQYCQFHLAISSPYDSEYPLVQSDVLRDMFFGKSNTRQMIRKQVTVNNCVFQHISWPTILIPIGVIILLSTGIMLVFWRMQNKMLQKNKSFAVKNKDSLERLQTASRQYDDAMQY